MCARPHLCVHFHMHTQTLTQGWFCRYLTHRLHLSLAERYSPCLQQSYTDLYPQRVKLLVCLLTARQKAVKGNTQVSGGTWGISLLSMRHPVVQPQLQLHASASNPFQQRQLIKCCRINFNLPPVYPWQLIATNQKAIPSTPVNPTMDQGEEML